jgi:DNA-directed RNA polymerase subunit M/transcription elongation factor TFIIS
MARIISNPDVYRKNIVLKLNELITPNDKKHNSYDTSKYCSGAAAAPEDIEKCRNFAESKTQQNAMNIEKSIYNYAIREATTKKTVKKWTNPFFVQIYEDRLRSIYRNLKNNQNFVDRIIEGEIRPDKLSKMNHIEMAPEQWKTLIDLKIKKDMNKFNSNDQSSTDMFQCRKCKSRRCQYYELQVRCADEGTSVFISCLDCGKHWRQN